MRCRVCQEYPVVERNEELSEADLQRVLPLCFSGLEGAMTGENSAKKIEQSPSALGYAAVVEPIRKLLMRQEHEEANERIITGLKDRTGRFLEFYIQMAGDLPKASEEIIELVWQADTGKDPFVHTAATITLAKLIPFDARVTRRIKAGLRSNDFFVIASAKDAAHLLPEEVLKKNTELQKFLSEANKYLSQLAG
jgi:hypothetical protein